MGNQLIQDIRYKLQNRVRRLNYFTDDYDRYFGYLSQLVAFFQNNIIISGVIEDLVRRQTDIIAVSEKIFEGERQLGTIGYDEQAAVAYHLIKKCLDHEKPEIIYKVGEKLTPGYKGKLYENVEDFHNILVDHLYEYLDENLDDQRAILAVLRRYKEKSEWFTRDRLYSTAVKETQKGEKQLAINLYQFLFEQGIDFSIEPRSISGEADLVSSQLEEDPIILDTKIFDPSSNKNKHYIAKGLNQIYIYTEDFNKPFGYLVDSVRFIV